jgi:hypothetical protein
VNLVDTQASDIRVVLFNTTANGHWTAEYGHAKNGHADISKRQIQALKKMLHL